MKTAAFVTLGCKINHYETQAIREEVLDLGYSEVSYSEPADVYVVNTCSVTATSATKSRKYVQRVARTNPQARVIVVGCSTPGEREQMAKIPQVAVLAGNEEKTLVGSYLDGGWKPGEPFPSRQQDIFRLNINRYTGRTRANIKVQDGCNSFCSFCVIPFLRGRSRSRHPDAVVEEVQRLAEAGFVEVVITGVHLQDYGGDLDPAVSLASMLERVAAVDGLRRVRLSSIGVRSFDAGANRSLYDVLENPVFCPHWHIPLQSGSNAVLRHMRRDYTVEEFAGVLEELQRRIGTIAVSSDVIVGHPGETEEDFQRTLDACRRFRFSKIHVFPYSPREGTLATKLGADVEAVDPMEIGQRARRLRDLEAELALEYKRDFVGRVVEVHVEGEANGSDTATGQEANGTAVPAKHDTSGQDTAGQDTGGQDSWLSGFTEHYLRVSFPAPSARAGQRFPGTFQSVRVDAAEPAVLRGAWAGEVAVV